MKAWLKNFAQRSWPFKRTTSQEEDREQTAEQKISKLAESRHSQAPRELVFNPLGRFAEAVKLGGQERVPEAALDEETQMRQQLSSIGVVAFVGPSGTGKSTRALKVARDYRISYLIDDGLLIYGSRIAAGVSAKKAPTRMESVRQAIFGDETRAANMRRALVQHLPASLMILGTSDAMLEKICHNLWLNKPAILIRIEDVTSEEERLEAKRTRLTEGKHTIPVPSMEIKHEFSGYLMEPLFKLRRRFDRYSEKNVGEGERTVVRPTFSSLGNYSISDEALSMMARLILAEVDGLAEMVRSRVVKQAYGVQINAEVALYYGYNAQEVLRQAQVSLGQSLERYTAINVLAVNLKAVRLSHEQAKT